MSIITQYVKRLSCYDFTLKAIWLALNKFTDFQVAAVIDSLFSHLNFVQEIRLEYNQLTDETGFKLAQYLTTNPTIRHLAISYNQFSEKTYLEIASALYVNSSLYILQLRAYETQPVDGRRVDIAFVNALRFNPVRPSKSIWMFSLMSQDYRRLKELAEKSTPPSMLEFLLCVHCNTEIFKTEIH
jgi:hypothetical protein